MTRVPVTTSSQGASDLTDGMSQQVQTLIDQAGTEAMVDERRHRDRFPIPYTFRLTPVDDDGQLLADETTTIVGKDLSLSGIGFSHDHPLSCRRAIISLDHPMVGPVRRGSRNHLDASHADRPLRKRLPADPHGGWAHSSR